MLEVGEEAHTTKEVERQAGLVLELVEVQILQLGEDTGDVAKEDAGTDGRVLDGGATEVVDTDVKGFQVAASPDASGTVDVDSCTIRGGPAAVDVHSLNQSDRLGRLEVEKMGGGTEELVELKTVSGVWATRGDEFESGNKVGDLAEVVRDCGCEIKGSEGPLA